MNVLPTKTLSGVSPIGTYKPKPYTATDSSIEPVDIYKVMVIPSWRNAIHDELHVLVNNKTWDLVSPPVDRSLVGCKWLFNIKKNPVGSISHNKVHLIAQGFSQAPGLDYHEMFSPDFKANIIRTILALVMLMKWKLR
ncbi:Retrovirus-related Pol polyprotein from transposon TNT 1-94 [Gossypium australe]|uniref:Retrovirus-related Pol polyprotein from transposon TNT 1-94 n=1 Tax=Gossypium australe TaxID=47621 RepID=A0A5B6WYF5_9ROSI|nr:Retrovirus-related Pol polyprotein from transposon TNT 1-94 [Gossypium australe]